MYLDRVTHHPQWDRHPASHTAHGAGLLAPALRAHEEFVDGCFPAADRTGKPQIQQSREAAHTDQYLPSKMFFPRPHFSLSMS